jgi:hypothetical protein
MLSSCVFAYTVYPELRGEPRIAKQIPCLSANSFLNRTPIPISHSHRLTIFRPAPLRAPKSRRINTCKSLSRQRILTSCRTIDLRKTEGEGALLFGKISSPFSLLARSFHSLYKECFTTLLHSSASALFLKTAGCHPAIPILKLASVLRASSAISTSLR